MNWWIGSCWLLTSLGVAAVDYRVQKRAGTRWLRDWPWRLAMYFALGGILTGVPVFIYQFGQSVISLINHPPTAEMMLALVPLALASVVAVGALRTAGRVLRGVNSQIEHDNSLAKVWRIAVGLLLLLLAAGAVWAGILGNFYLLGNH